MLMPRNRRRGVAGRALARRGGLRRGGAHDPGGRGPRRPRTFCSGAQVLLAGSVGRIDEASELLGAHRCGYCRGYDLLNRRCGSDGLGHVELANGDAAAAARSSRDYPRRSTSPDSSSRAGSRSCRTSSRRSSCSGGSTRHEAVLRQLEHRRSRSSTAGRRRRRSAAARCCCSPANARTKRPTQRSRLRPPRRSAFRSTTPAPCSSPARPDVAPGNG